MSLPSPLLKSLLPTPANPIGPPLALLAASFLPLHLSHRPDYQPDPLPELPILPDSHSPIPPQYDFPLLFPPPLRAAALFISPTDPILPIIREAQLLDPDTLAIREKMAQRPEEESNPLEP